MNIIFPHSCESMPEIENDSIHCCVTSPPYFGLRNYGSPDEIGQEKTLDDYVARLTAVFREVRRVLRPDGTLWLNLGDSYAGSRCGPAGRSSRVSAIHATRASSLPLNGLKVKDQMLVPHTVAMALRADGWWLRDTIIWHKPNPMPSSVRDRTTPAHEYIFLLTKSARYFYDQHAIREPLAKSSQARLAQDVASQNGSSRANGGKKTNGTMKVDNATYSGRAWEPGVRRTQRGLNGEQVHPEGVNHTLGSPFIGANARSVWSIATAGYRGAHFAVMPRELVRRCVLAGSPAEGVILDPFMGSGTVAEVALGCGRSYVGYEINPEYRILIDERLGIFASVSGDAR